MNSDDINVFGYIALILGSMSAGFGVSDLASPNFGLMIVIAAVFFCISGGCFVIAFYKEDEQSDEVTE